MSPGQIGFRFSDAILESNRISAKRVLDKRIIPEENQRVLTSILMVQRARPGRTEEQCGVLSRMRSAVGVIMGEANKYYVTVAVDQCIIAIAVIVRAENKDAAAQRAEMKVALQMRDAITVRAINVRDV